MMKKGLKKINKAITVMLSAILIISTILTINVQAATGNDIVNEAYRHIGKPYVYGATGPDSFDCSGFTQYVYRNAAGIDITRTTYSQINIGDPVSYNELQLGDLVFTYGVEHVGIYVGGGQYIHAPQPGDSVKVSPITSFHAARRVPGISNIQNGWFSSNGKWYWYENGVMFKNNWKQIGGKWYLFLEDGTMFANNWKQLNGKWYCFSENGDALTGWQFINEKWYYFNSNCEMVTDTVIDGWKIDSNGVATKL